MAETENKKNSPLNPRAPEFIPSKLKPSYYVCPCPIYSKPKKRFLKERIIMKPPRNLPPRILNKRVWTLKKKTKTFLNGNTSVMVRNIPNNLGRSDLLRILDLHCKKVNNYNDDEDQTLSSYDFLYLPMDFVKCKNLGYAFVNFTTTIAAERFCREFHNLSWNDRHNKSKICQIAIAKFQGKEEMSKHFKDSKFPCHTNDYLPVVLSPASDGFSCYRLTTLGHRVVKSRRGA